ncbi:amidohydrolase [Thermococcus paralvinellae]|uniref:5-methylthioadenosine/S-adenosylhomocysteine deaminase n=1 Tax=Thermococcus paralvinellae TaxID=582419 RepID=W0I6T4_9EURY|nr:amidohydrolase [Thermococcus paralvinellae]AHF80165.1 S-adenosylhomocysteine deaminase [Thermococcus paralvinellae]
MGILIKGVFTPDRKKATIYIEENIIQSINDEMYKDDFVIDGNRKLILPAFYNTHTHLSMSLFRGIVEDMWLKDWLEKVVWPMEKHINEEYVYWGAMLGGLELIRSGIAAIADMYFFMDKVSEALELLGLRGVLGTTIFEFPSPEAETPEDAFKIVENFAKKYKNRELIKPSIAPHSIYSCNIEILQQAKEIADRYGLLVQIHLSETKWEVYEVQKRYGKRPVELLESIGFLDKNVLAAHAVWLTKAEIRTLAKYDVKVSHNPVSNLKLASGGVMPYPEMKEYGVLVTLGTDGVASNNNFDMFEEMKVFAISQKNHRWDPTIAKAKEVFKVATENGAKALGFKAGRVEEGYLADLVLIDLNSPHLKPFYDPITLAVYSMRAGDVDGLIVNGKPLMLNREILVVNEDKLMEKAERKAFELYEKVMGVVK